MVLDNRRNLYFLGIGGIGMSALAKYFKSLNFNILGYDSTPSEITKELEKLGIDIIYNIGASSLHTDRVNFNHLQPADTIVIRTAAVSEDEPIYKHFQENNFQIYKRAEILGEITKDKKALCVAGTHGKTTISTMLAHLMHSSRLGANAFLGGISNNYHTNVLIDNKSDFVVVEADEFDHSFHHLTPSMSVISAVDPDHLDIYNDLANYQESFIHYARLVRNALIINQTILKKGLDLPSILGDAVKIYTYGVIVEGVACSCGLVQSRRENLSSQQDDFQSVPDFYASNIRSDGGIRFDFTTPDGCMPDMQLGVPVWVNIENSVAALAMGYLNGLSEAELRTGLASFKGVQRRFDLHVNKENIAYIDDYAHHPEEIRKSLLSVKKLFPNRHLVVIFQPHLYSRTRDFAAEFAQSLSIADEVVLLPIYPAREEPIEGVTSAMIAKDVSVKVVIVDKGDLLDFIKKRILAQGRLNEKLVIMTVGAGSIGNFARQIKDLIDETYQA